MKALSKIKLNAGLQLSDQKFNNSDFCAEQCVTRVTVSSWICSDSLRCISKAFINQDEINLISTFIPRAFPRVYIPRVMFEKRIRYYQTIFFAPLNLSPRSFLCPRPNEPTVPPSLFYPTLALRSPMMIFISCDLHCCSASSSCP